VNSCMKFNVVFHFGFYAGNFVYLKYVQWMINTLFYANNIWKTVIFDSHSVGL
jgi:hypothetical protein